MAIENSFYLTMGPDDLKKLIRVQQSAIRIRKGVMHKKYRRFSI